MFLLFGYGKLTAFRIRAKVADKTTNVGKEGKG
jgi:hypothetical protein